MAESRSVKAVDAPCMAVPPDMLILVLAAGDAVREDAMAPFVVVVAFFLDERESEMRGPEADGGGFAVMGKVMGFALSVINGNWVASGRDCLRARLSATWSLCRCRAGRAR